MGDIDFFMKDNEILLLLYKEHKEHEGREGSPIIDYIRTNNKIIYLVNRNGYKIIEQDCSDGVRIIYQNNGKLITHLTLKNNFIIFLEENTFKKIDLETFKKIYIEEIIDCNGIPSDFCVL